MALTRKFLKALEIEGDKADQIIEAHTETLEGLKSSLETAQDQAGKLPEIQQRLEAAQADLEAARKDSYKVKYEAIKEDFEAYKAEQTQKESRAAKENAYRALLKSAGISEKRIDSVLKVSDVEGVELTEKGEIKGKEKLSAAIREEWADFIETTEIQGAETSSPPVNHNGPEITKEEILNISDVEERQKAILHQKEFFFLHYRHMPSFEPLAQRVVFGRQKAGRFPGLLWGLPYSSTPVIYASKSCCSSLTV